MGMFFRRLGRGIGVVSNLGMTARATLVFGLLFAASLPAYATESVVVYRGKTTAAEATKGFSSSVKRFISKTLTTGHSSQSLSADTTRTHRVDGEVYGTVSQHEVLPTGTASRKLKVDRFMAVKYWEAKAAETNSDGREHRTEIGASIGVNQYLSGESHQMSGGGGEKVTTHELRSELKSDGGLFSKRGVTKLVVTGTGADRTVKITKNLKYQYVGGVRLWPVGRNLVDPVGNGYAEHLTQ